jgi:hypothetical protein
MASPVKRVKAERVAVIHNCNQVERPEDGYVYKVIEMAKAITAINDKLTAISGTVTTLYDDSTGMKAVKSKSRTNFEAVIKILGVVLMLGMFVLGYLNLIKKTDQLKNEVNMINTPVRTRGGVIQWWPSGVVIDSLKKDKGGK